MLSSTSTSPGSSSRRVSPVAVAKSVRHIGAEAAASSVALPAVKPSSLSIRRRLRSASARCNKGMACAASPSGFSRNSPAICCRRCQAWSCCSSCASQSCNWRCSSALAGSARRRICHSMAARTMDSEGCPAAITARLRSTGDSNAARRWIHAAQRYDWKCPVAAPPAHG